MSTTPVWQQSAACRGLPLRWFFGPVSETPRALAVCDRCPVRRDCLEWVLGSVLASHDYGVFGGTTEDERKQIRRDREETAA